MKKSIEQLLKIFGANVKKQRLEKNMTIEELSVKTGISEKYLDKIEKGQGKRVSTSHLFKIAEGLEVLPHVLVKGL